MGDAPTLADDSDDDPGGTEPPEAEPAGEGDEDRSEPSVADATDDLDLDEQPDQTGDVNEATVDLSEDDLGGGLFSGVEDSESGSESESSDDEGGEADEGGDLEAAIADGLEGNAAAMEDAINDGAARLAVVGLTDDDFEDADAGLDKESLETEFQETFEAFRLGYFGSRAVEEYVLEPADGDVSPAWGLAGSALIAAAMIVWLRPDGDEAVAKGREAIGNLGGSL